MTTLDELNAVKEKLSVGDQMKLKVYRDGQYLDITLTLGEDKPETVSTAYRVESNASDVA